MNKISIGKRRALVLFSVLVVVGVAIAISITATTHAAHGHTAAPPKAPTKHKTPTPPHGFVSGQITAVGDSVMVDYEQILKKDLPHVAVHASVGMQVTTGLSELRALRRRGRLGTTVIIALGTNGPFTPALMSQLLSVVHGASRVVLVTSHVDQPWQHQNNALILAAARTHPTIVVANWEALAAKHPQWLYSDGTHLPIDGPGARALAALVTHAVHHR